LTVTDFKDISAGLQSLAIVLAALLGGGWALFQFFSLGAIEKARLELEKIKKDLLQRGVIAVELVTESFEVEGSYFLHVVVTMRNIGSRVEIADWSQAILYAKRFHKPDEATLAPIGPTLSAWQGESLSEYMMRLVPGFSQSESFLIPIPQAGVYFISFGIAVSSPVRADTVDSFKTIIGQQGLDFQAASWKANQFVSVPQGQPSTAHGDEIGPSVG
jgi:hypothetical protein